jgi:hypothetical protein
MLTPEVLPHYLPFRDANHKELLLSGLRRAAGDAA